MEEQDSRSTQSLGSLLALPAAFVVLVASSWTILCVLVLYGSSVGLILAAWVSGAGAAVALLLLWNVMRLLL